MVTALRRWACRLGLSLVFLIAVATVAVIRGDWLPTMIVLIVWFVVVVWLIHRYGLGDD